MHFPRQIGWVQIVLFLIALCGVWLLFAAIGGLRGKREVETLVGEDGHKYHRYRRMRRFSLSKGFSGIALVLAAVVLIGLTGAIQEYLGLTGKILVAHVHSTKVKTSGNIPMMSVDLILYDDNGNKVSDDVYIVNGDEVFIGGDVIQLAGILNILGFHSGYKVTKLEGMYSDTNLERTQQHTVVVLNGGDDDLFNTAYQKGLNSFLVTAAYKNGSTVPANGIGYNICASQDAIVPQPDNIPC
jgi:hypothetical protein